MAIRIYEDLVEGMTYRENDRNGELRRPYRVDGLPSNNGITDAAIYAVDGGKIIPRAGDRHQSLNDLVMREIEVVPVRGSRTACRVYARYVKVRKRLLDIRINGTSLFTQTNFDKEGKILVVGYKSGAKPDEQPPDPPKDGSAASNSNGWKYNYVKAPKIQPDTLMEIVYLEDRSALKLLDKFRGRLNVKPWQGGDPLEWCCLTINSTIESPIPTNMDQLGKRDVIDGQSGLAKFNWIVTYSFRKTPTYKIVGGKVTGGPGWNQVQLFVDQYTGRSPTDIDPKAGGWPTKKKGNGFLEPETFETADFDELNLVKIEE